MRLSALIFLSSLLLISLAANFSQTAHHSTSKQALAISQYAGHASPEKNPPARPRQAPPKF